MNDKIETEQNLDYCPKCGKELESDDPYVRCPKHGIVNIDFWLSNWEEDD